MAFDNSTATTRMHEANLNLHMLGQPRAMWTLDPLLSSFSDSSIQCKENCEVKYVPPPTTDALALDPSNATQPLPEGDHSNRFDGYLVRPSQGPIHGGTLITIHGIDFIDSVALGCRFQGTVTKQGGKSQGHGLVNGTFVDMNHIICRSPASMTVGVTDVFLTNDGENFGMLPVQFEYSLMVPTLISISVEKTPSSGSPPRYCPIRSPLAGGTTITIHGEGFMQSDSSELLQFRMGEMPAMTVHKFIDSKTIVIKTPPIHSRFWGDKRVSGDENSVHMANPNPDTHPMPPPGRPSPLNAQYPEMTSSSKRRQHPMNYDANYYPWGTGKPFDCSLDAPGTTCYRPAFTIRVTNDGGRTWSGFPPYNTTVDTMGTLIHRTNCVLYHDLIVSNQGDDDWGDGTYTRPFRSLYRAAEYAHGSYDRIVLQRGAYSTYMLTETLLETKKLEIVRETTDHLHQHSPKFVQNGEESGPTHGSTGGRLVDNANHVYGSSGDPAVSMDQSIRQEDSMGMLQPEDIFLGNWAEDGI